MIRNHRRDTPGGGPFEGINHQQQFHQVLVHRAAGRLHSEDVSAAHILLNLYISFAIAKARNHSLAASQTKKSADLIAQRLVRGTAEDLELIIYASAMRLAPRFLAGPHVDLLFRRCPKRRPPRPQRPAVSP